MAQGGCGGGWVDGGGLAGGGRGGEAEGRGGEKEEEAERKLLETDNFIGKKIIAEDSNDILLQASAQIHW